MKKTTLFLALVLCLSAIGCSKSVDPNVFFSEWEGVSNDMAKKMADGDVDGAKTIFDGKKENLKSQCKAVIDSGYAQSNTREMGEKTMKITMVVMEAVVQGSMKVGVDRAKIDKQNAMVSEFQAICRG